MSEQKHIKIVNQIDLSNCIIKEGFAIYDFDNNYTPAEFHYYIEPLMEYCSREFPNLILKIGYNDPPCYQIYCELFNPNPDGFIVTTFKKAYRYILNLFK